jgi:acyl carrier protein
MQSAQSLDERIISLIASGVPGKFKKVPIERGTSLQKELGLDSIGMLALVFRFEEFFGVDIAQMGIDIDLAKLKTVDDLVRAGHEILSRAQAASGKGLL